MPNFLMKYGRDTRLAVYLYKMEACKIFLRILSEQRGEITLSCLFLFLCRGGQLLSGSLLVLLDSFQKGSECMKRSLTQPTLEDEAPLSSIIRCALIMWNKKSSFQHHWGHPRDILHCKRFHAFPEIL